jgi:hypothetical protein
MAAPAKGDHVQTPTTTESITSTVFGTSPRMSPDTRIEGLTASPTTFGFDKQGGARQQSDDGDCPPVIPPTHSNRTLVVCFDGTGDQFDNDNSNIVQLVALMKKDDRHQQLVYYQVCISHRVPTTHSSCRRELALTLHLIPTR